jgi:hypothetical protein
VERGLPADDAVRNGELQEKREQILSSTPSRTFTAPLTAEIIAQTRESLGV